MPYNSPDPILNPPQLCLCSFKASSLKTSGVARICCEEGHSWRLSWDTRGGLHGRVTQTAQWLIVLWLKQYWSKELWSVDICTSWSCRLHNTWIVGCQIYSKVNLKWNCWQSGVARAPVPRSWRRHCLKQKTKWSARLTQTQTTITFVVVPHAQFNETTKVKLVWHAEHVCLASFERTFIRLRVLEPNFTRVSVFAEQYDEDVSVCPCSADVTRLHRYLVGRRWIWQRHRHAEVRVNDKNQAHLKKSKTSVKIRRISHQSTNQTRSIRGWGLAEIYPKSQRGLGVSPDDLENLTMFARNTLQLHLWKTCFKVLTSATSLIWLKKHFHKLLLL